MNSGWIESEQEKLLGFYSRLLQLEVNKYQDTFELIYNIIDVLEERPINEVKEHILLEPVPKNTPLFDAQNNSFPLVDKLFESHEHTISSMG